MTDADLSAILAAYRERDRLVSIGYVRDPQDVPRLLAAVEAVLAQHRPGRIAILGSLCKRHENHRHFSITAIEAADVVACPDCYAAVFETCAGCGTSVRLDKCPARSAISRALLGEDGTDA